MTDDAFEKLANALDRLANGFPRTQSGVELRILKKIFSSEEATIAHQLSGKWEPLEIIARRIGLSTEETRVFLEKMAERGFLWSFEKNGIPLFRLAPFIVGIYESQLERMDHELAHLVEQYALDGGMEGIMRLQPALHRVVPAQSALKSESILPYDDVRAILSDSKTFRLHDCICKVEQDFMGRTCTFPKRSCLSFSQYERPHTKDDISKEEALTFLDETEKMGLVHTVSNIEEGVGYVCNCCGCCCAILRSITEWGIENSVAYANYYSQIDPEVCNDCGICIERCQVHAIVEKDGIPFVQKEKCIGCGLCVTGCPNDAARLERKAEAEIVAPPKDFRTWEKERLRNRGLEG
jgi:ferredoxin